MEFTKKDKLLSLIFPVITALYGIILCLSGGYPLFKYIMGGVTIAAGVITGVLVITLRINTTACLKMQTIAFVVTVWLHIMTQTGIVMSGTQNIVDAIYVIYYLAVDLGSIVLMMFKLPDEITAVQRLIVFFSNPILFTLINRLMDIFADFLKGLGLLS